MSDGVLCGCMGPIGSDPYCPCGMRLRSLEPSKRTMKDSLRHAKRLYPIPEAEIDRSIAALVRKRLTGNEPCVITATDLARIDEHFEKTGQALIEPAEIGKQMGE